MPEKTDGIVYDDKGSVTVSAPVAKAEAEKKEN